MGPEVLARLIDRHAPALVLYARQWCDAPEDIVQEAFLQLVRQKVPPRNVLPWLYRVVRNAALSAARASRRRQRHEAIAAGRSATWFQPAEGTGLDAEAAAAALGTLPVEQREVIVAYLWGGLTFKEIAALTGHPSSTIHRWYQTGIASLRERLRVSCP